MPKAGASLLHQQQLAHKVRSYEDFLTHTLKADLARATDVKAKFQAELQELEDLEHNLRMLQRSGQQSIKTQVDVGSEVLCTARIPDVSRVYLSIGLGFHVEATLAEAPKIIGVRKAAVQAKVEKALDQCARIRAHIKLVEQALHELMSITPA